MQEVARREIDGLDFEVTQLAVKDARAVLLRLGKTLGPSLAELAKEGTSLKGEAVMVALGQLAVNLSESDLEFMCEKFYKVSKVKTPDGPHFVPLGGAADTVFAGKLATMFKWLWFCI